MEALEISSGGSPNDDDGTESNARDVRLLLQRMEVKVNGLEQRVRIISSSPAAMNEQFSINQATPAASGSDASKESGVVSKSNGLSERAAYKTPLQLMNETSNSFRLLEERLMRQGLDGTEDDGLGRALPADSTSAYDTAALHSNGTAASGGLPTTAREWKEVTAHNAQVVQQLKQMQNRFGEGLPAGRSQAGN